MKGILRGVDAADVGVTTVAMLAALVVACSRPEAGSGPTGAASAPTQPSASASPVSAPSVVPSASLPPVVDAPCATLTEPSATGSHVDAAKFGEPDHGSFGLGANHGSTHDAARGPAEVIGIGPVSASGHGPTAETVGNGRGQLGGSHDVRAPRVQAGNVRVEGGLSSDAVNSVVRRSFGRHRLCYESGRQKDAKLAGAVVARFTIDASGSVVKATADPCTTMPDPDVTSCDLRGISSLKFPASQGGDTTVVFPILFSSE